MVYERRDVLFGGIGEQRLEPDMRLVVIGEAELVQDAQLVVVFENRWGLAWGAAMKLILSLGGIIGVLRRRFPMGIFGGRLQGVSDP